jgi:nucleotide-binding universal stress UspA family protein
MNTNLYERILVPTDLSEFDDLAIRYALLFNKRLGSKITMLHAEEVSWLGAEHPVGYYFDNPNEAKEELKLRLDEFAHRTTPESARVATIFADDAPERAIVKTADEVHADLIMMATHGRYGLRRAIVGSVTESVLRHTTRPVLTVTPRLFAINEAVALRTILCPVNFSEVARASLEEATAMAEAFDAELIVMHVAEGGLENVEEQFSGWVDPLVRDRTRYRQIVVKGDPAGAVLEVADQIRADLVVVGAQHKFFHDTTVVGTTTERITRFARHAVLTVVRKPAIAPVRERELALTV